MNKLKRYQANNLNICIYHVKFDKESVQSFESDVDLCELFSSCASQTKSNVKRTGRNKSNAVWIQCRFWSKKFFHNSNRTFFQALVCFGSDGVIVPITLSSILPLVWDGRECVLFSLWTFDSIRWACVSMETIRNTRHKRTSAFISSRLLTPILEYIRIRLGVWSHAFLRSYIYRTARDYNVVRTSITRYRLGAPHHVPQEIDRIYVNFLTICFQHSKGNR